MELRLGALIVVELEERRSQLAQELSAMSAKIEQQRAAVEVEKQTLQKQLFLARRCVVNIDASFVCLF